MRKLAAIALIFILAIGAWGCSQAPQNQTPVQPPPAQNGSQNPAPPSTEPDPASLGQSRESLGGLRLGMTVPEVEKILTTPFQKEELREDDGTFKEPFAIRTYSDCVLVIGKTSGKVLQIDVFAAAYPTTMGVKVGDASTASLEKYRQKYPEWVGNQSPEKLAGWFVTEPGVLLIFSSRENRERSNINLTADSKIHAITLGYDKFFD